MGSLAPSVVAVIAGMSLVTYATKAGGFWVLNRITISERVEAGLEVLPGAIIVAILAPELVAAGPAEWAASAVVLVVMVRTENVLLALLGGLAAVLAFRTVV
ncbi:AzlD family protein [Haloarcula onubensis]|uniref:AzlD domain-containing protein n=1 Tax=Haloarcula onubensis TaxID=2950539 RepID=A0ABU2FK17_9EURY|nr:AzlD domain-containing protein [Halomicroarcula sp. S3CR25-11]MDS0280691.1 AzlD domain-containing protein [Halomicroarcula sp. S3CR25-11]